MANDQKTAAERALQIVESMGGCYAKDQWVPYVPPLKNKQPLKDGK